MWCAVSVAASTSPPTFSLGRCSSCEAGFVAGPVPCVLRHGSWEHRPMEETVAGGDAPVLRHAVCGALQACRGGGGGGGGVVAAVAAGLGRSSS